MDNCNFAERGIIDIDRSLKSWAHMLYFERINHLNIFKLKLPMSKIND